MLLALILLLVSVGDTSSLILTEEGRPSGKLYDSG